jgi:hypothetical protein
VEKKLNACVSPSKYICRKCWNKIPIVDLEAVVYEELKSFFSAPEQVGARLRQVHQNFADKANLLQTHRLEIQKVRDD